jgi:hypothetical protein
MNLVYGTQLVDQGIEVGFKHNRSTRPSILKSITHAFIRKLHPGSSQTLPAVGTQRLADEVSPALYYRMYVVNRKPTHVLPVCKARDFLASIGSCWRINPCERVRTMPCIGHQAEARSYV